MVIPKLSMAVEQLEDALQKYFEGRYHSSIVLAGAAEELFAGYMKHHGFTNSYSSDLAASMKIANVLRKRAGEPPATRQGLHELLKGVYNTSKHADRGALEERFDPKAQAAQILDRTIRNFDSLSSYDLPVLPLAQRFIEQSISDIDFGND